MKQPYDSAVSGLHTDTFIYDFVTLPAKANDVLEVSVTQTVSGLVTLNHQASSVFLSPRGAHGRLPESEIVGRYPAKGSTSSPAEYLPHIALKRQSLPWERHCGLSGIGDNTPWLALVTFTEKELGGPPNIQSVPASQLPPLLANDYKDTPPTQLIDYINVSIDVCRKALPMSSELAALCHVRQLKADPSYEQVSSASVPGADTSASDAMWTLDDDATVAVVIGSRLPTIVAGQKPDIHHVFLVSIENRDDLFDLNPSKQPTPLAVLDHWSFTPNVGGDFRDVLAAIPHLPHGGVLKFGRRASTDGSMIATDQGFLSVKRDGGAVDYRGPLCADLAAPRSPACALRRPQLPPAGTPVQKGDPSHSFAAAFELGRLLTLADDGLMSDLQDVRWIMGCPIRDKTLMPELPSSLRKPRWDGDPEELREKLKHPDDPISVKDTRWNNQLGDMVSLTKVDDELNPVGVPSGLVKSLKDGLTQNMQAVAQPGIAGAVVDVPLVRIDIDNISVADLDRQFHSLVLRAR